MSIQFPILNISLSNLSSQDLEETHIGDLWDYPGDNGIFEEYYNNQKYVDQSGHIFKIIGNLLAGQCRRYADLFYYDNKAIFVFPEVHFLITD